MNVSRHSGQRRHGFSLAAGRHKHHLLVRIVPHHIDVNQRILRYLQIAELRSNGNDVDHAPAFYDNLPSVLVRYIDDLLHPVHVGGECRNNETLLPVLRENQVERPADGLLRHRKSRPLRVRAVAHQGQHTFLSDLGKTLQINGITEYRRVIYLEIARMNDCSGR